MQPSLLPWKLAVVFGLGTWLLAFGAGPLLHLIDHQGDHFHRPDGSVVYVDDGTPPRTPTHRGPPADEPASKHGAVGSLHFGPSALTALSFRPLLFTLGSAVLGPLDRSVRAPILARWITPRAARAPPL